MGSLSRGMTRRGALGLFITATGAGLAAACAPTAVAPTAAPAKPAAATTAPAAPVASAAPSSSPVAGAATVVAPAGPAPKPGGTLKVGKLGDVANIDGHSWGPANGFSIFMIFDMLTNYDDSLTPQPELAESWQQSPDAKQLTLNIRKNVMFHSGKELTSEDVVYNLQRPLNPTLQTTIASFTILRGFVPAGTTFEARDKYTVVINSPTPWTNVFDYLQNLNIMEKATAEGPDSKTKAVGTGPFKFVEWKQGELLRFAKNEQYWKTGRPYLNEVVVNIRQDPQAMVTELEAGALDLILAPSWRDYSRLKTNPKFQALKIAQPSTFHQFQPNSTMAPFNNKLVRQALNYAIDRKRIVDTVMLGETTVKSLPWLPSSPAYEASKVNHYAFDLDKAKSLLAQAGVGNLNMGFFFTPSTPEYGQQGEIYQSDLAKIGVTLKLNNLQIAPLLDTIQKQTFDGVYSLNDPWASMSPTTLFTSSSSAQTVKNNGGFKTPEYDALVAAVAQEPDAAKRKALYPALNDYLLDQSFHMPITESPGRILMGANVRGLASRQMDRFIMGEAWLA